MFDLARFIVTGAVALAVAFVFLSLTWETVRTALGGMRHGYGDRPADLVFTAVFALAFVTFAALALANFGAALQWWSVH